MSTPSDYITVFDIADAGYKAAYFPATGLIFVAVGLLLVLVRKRLAAVRFAGFSGPLGRVFPWLFLGFSVFWVTSAFALTFIEYRFLKTDYESGLSQVVAGEVRDYRPLPPNGRGEESFTVDSISFGYSDYRISAGYNKSVGKGGLIREGQQVRIHYIGKRIVRLEIASSQLPSVGDMSDRIMEQKTLEARMIRENPVLRRIGPGMTFGMVFVTLMWSVGWRHYMRYLFRSGPPYGRGWEITLRLLFALMFFGACENAVTILYQDEMSGDDYIQAALIAIAVIGFFGLLDLIARRRQKREEFDTPA